MAPKGATRAGAPERLDAAIGKAAAKRRKNPVIRVIGKAARIVDQPPLILASAATLAAGLALRQPRLARAGIRMLAGELVARGARAVVERRSAGASAAQPLPARGSIGTASNALVDAGMKLGSAMLAHRRGRR